MVYGYLDIIGQYPLPGNNRLQLHLNSLKNLTQFCDRVRSIAFPEITASKLIKSYKVELLNKVHA